MSIFETAKLSASPPPVDHMKAFTVWQPWATFLAIGEKDHETRGWATKYRGPIVLHAAARVWPDGTLADEMHDIIERREKIGKYDDFSARGALLAVMDLVDCIPTRKANVSTQERALGDWSDGRFAWRMRVAKVFKKPIPFKGAQGLWNLPLSVIADELPVRVDPFSRDFRLPFIKHLSQPGQVTETGNG